MRLILLAALLLPAPATAAGPALGPFEAQGDIGAPKLPGSATFSGGKFALTAGGYNIARTRDEFHFVWRKVKGDFSIEGRVAFTGPGITPHRKAGVMARASLAEGSAHLDAAVHGEGPRALVIRQTDGGTTQVSELEPRIPVPEGVKPAPVPLTTPQTVWLARHGNKFTAVIKAAGQPEVRKEVELDLPQEIYLGLFLSAHNPDVIETAMIDQVRLAAKGN